MLGTPMTPGTGLIPQSPLTPGAPYDDSKYAYFLHTYSKAGCLIVLIVGVKTVLWPAVYACVVMYLS